MSHGRHHYPESYVNGLTSNRPIKPNLATAATANRSSQKMLPSTFQPEPLKRQQSLSFDKNGNTQRLPEANNNTREPVRTNITNNQSKRSNGSYRISNVEQQKRP
jgi:hypothetical protein